VIGYTVPLTPYSRLSPCEVQWYSSLAFRTPSSCVFSLFYSVPPGKYQPNYNSWVSK